MTAQTYTITRPVQYKYKMADSPADKEDRKREVCCSSSVSFISSTTDRLQYNRLAQREFRKMEPVLVAK